MNQFSEKEKKDWIEIINQLYITDIEYKFLEDRRGINFYQTGDDEPFCSFYSQTKEFKEFGNDYKEQLKGLIIMNYELNISDKKEKEL